MCKLTAPPLSILQVFYPKYRGLDAENHLNSRSTFENVLKSCKDKIVISVSKNLSSEIFSLQPKEMVDYFSGSKCFI